MAHLLFAGYFGCGNIGDDAILLGFLHSLQSIDPSHTFEVLSGSPDQTQRDYNLNAVPRKDLGRVSDAIRRCDALIFPGGSIFQDVTSTRSVAYYRSLISKAKKHGKKVFLLGQGVGPVTSLIGKMLTKESFTKADLIAVRDPDSLNTLKKLGVQKKIYVTADSALLLETLPSEELAFGVGGRKAIAISARDLPGKSDMPKLFAGFSDLLYRNGFDPHFLTMDQNEDEKLISAVEKLHGGRVLRISKTNSPTTIQMRLARMDGIVSMRLHGAILGLNAGLNPFIVDYDPKTAAFAKLLGLERPPSATTTTPQKLFDSFSAHFKAQESIGEKVKQSYAELRKLAGQNAALAQEYLSPRGSKTPSGFH